MVVENIYRHLQMGDRTPEVAAVEAVDEVGNPTILATFTVIAAILPMAFVSRDDGAVHAADPGRRVGGDARVARGGVHRDAVARVPAAQGARARGAQRRTTARTRRRRRRGSRASTRGVMTPLMDRRGAALGFYGGVVGAAARVGRAAVREGGAGEDAAVRQQERVPGGARPAGGHDARDDERARRRRSPRYLRRVPEVKSTEVYAGTAAPFNFNGLVRHYFMRSGANVADVQVNLVPQGRPVAAESCDRRRRASRRSTRSRGAYGASAKVAEIPPGPPVLSTLVAEVYAGDDATRLEAARAGEARLRDDAGRRGRGLDGGGAAAEARSSAWIACAPRRRERASSRSRRRSISRSPARRPASRRRPTAREGTAIVPRLPRRAALVGRRAARAADRDGHRAAAARAVRDRAAVGTREASRVRKDLRPAIYVTGDVAGAIESPVYAILEMNRKLDAIRVNGASIARYNAVQPRAPGGDGDQVGRRVAGDDRGVPRPRSRLRDRARADLRARRGLVPVVQDPARDHGADPAHAHRHPAGPRDQRARSSRRRR